MQPRKNGDEHIDIRNPHFDRRLVEVRESLVKRCLAEADQLSSAGDLSGALQELQTAAAESPCSLQVIENLVAVRSKLVSA